MVGRAAFTMSSRDNLFSVVLISIAILFLPLVFLAFVLPRLGGPVLVLGSAVIALTSLPAAEFNVPAAASVIALVALPMFLVGAGFTWSGLRPEGRK
jgi:integral membrane sensor domain MASE1